MPDGAREVMLRDEREGRVGINTERESPAHGSVTRAAPGSSPGGPGPAHNPQIERCSECWSQAINGDKLLAHQLAITQDMVLIAHADCN